MKRYSEGSLFRRFVIPKVRFSENERTLFHFQINEQSKILIWTTQKTREKSEGHRSVLQNDETQQGENETYDYLSLLIP